MSEHLEGPARVNRIRGRCLRHGVRFHELCHYHASLVIRHGESVKVVQARLGHASAVETLNTYAHLWPDSEDRTRTAIDEALGRAADIPRTLAADTVQNCCSWPGAVVVSLPTEVHEKSSPVLRVLLHAVVAGLHVLAVQVTQDALF